MLKLTKIFDDLQTHGNLELLSVTDKAILYEISKNKIEVGDSVRKNFPNLFPASTRIQLHLIDSVGLIFYPFSDSVMSNEIRKFGYWEKVESDWYIKRLNNKKIFLNIGANVGYHAIVANKLAQCKQTIVVEPNPLAIAYLKLNGIINGVRLTVENVALGNTNQSADFYLDDTNFGDGRIQKFKNSNFVSKVIVRNVEAFLEEIPAPHLIMIDIQGAECAILEPILRMTNADIIFEFSPFEISSNLPKAINILRTKTNKYNLKAVVDGQIAETDYNTIYNIFKFSNRENINLMIERNDV